MLKPVRLTALQPATASPRTSAPAADNVRRAVRENDWCRVARIGKALSLSAIKLPKV